MDSRHAGPLHFLDGSTDIKGPTPTGIDINQQGQIGRTRDTASVLGDIVERGHAQVGETEGCIGHSRPRKVERLMTRSGRQHRTISVYGSDDGQRCVIF